MYICIYGYPPLNGTFKLLLLCQCVCVFGCSSLRGGLLISKTVLQLRNRNIKLCKMMYGVCVCVCRGISQTRAYVQNLYHMGWIY